MEVGSDPPAAWRVLGRALDLSRPVVMGILNVTPDSFSDGGELEDVPAALARALALVEEGAGILDVGGESTRPGAREVPADEELERVVPVVASVAERVDVPVSIDTRKAVVARAALDAGAALVNDVSGLRHDPAMGRVVAERGAGLVLMHMRGDPATMQECARYRDVMGEVVRELGDRLALARGAGIADDQVVVDPGIGFAKTAEQSIAVLRELPRLLALGRPILVGPSRKSFLGHLLGTGVRDRLAGTVAACVLAYLGGARIFRVHEVRPVVEALAVAHAVAGGSAGLAGSVGA
jgi:dihydropteroate synthase